MINLSPRLALIAAVLFIASALPVWFHVAKTPTSDECRDPEAFFLASEIANASMRKPVPRRRTSISVEGRLYTTASEPLKVLAFRSYASSRFYASPMSFGFDTMAYIIPREVRSLEVKGNVVPVHWSQYEMLGKVYIEAYLYVQGGRPVSHPLQSGLRLAVDQLISGTRPLNVLILSAVGDIDETQVLE
ncbi:MAG: hypothetical protein ACJAYI_001460, partial [Myxococcota bacterium]